ncbi:MAG: Vacuolar ATP synthase subunit C [Geoglossum simile]|nr:MAG: Vacuolar ATP synthase subunit C [Geoglossum simile]
MSKSVKYLLVSLPTSISASDDNDEAFAALSTTVPKDYGAVCRFRIPEFKIGTLDALVQQADELAKLGSACEGVVSKVADSLGNILDGDESKISQQKTVNDRPEIVSIDGDVKSKQTQYTQVRTSLITLQRKQTGNLSTRSLTPLVDPSFLIQDSEYIETLLVAVPNPLSKEFLKSYETLVPMVVPRSAARITSDQEYTLFAVTIFKKHSQEFVHKCRERKWTPREYKYVEGGMEAEQKEVDHVTRDEQKLWGEALRLFRTAWGESVMIWMHVLALRVFVETVLRYGLPLKFVCGVITSTPKLAKKAKFSLDSTYSYLGGNAFGRDKKGRIKTKDDSLSSDMAAMGIGGVHGGEDGEYTAYVYYEFEIS